MIKLPYIPETKDGIIVEQKKAGLFLVEVQKHVDGQFLVFDTSPQKETPLTLEQRVAKLEVEIAKLKG